MASMVHHLDTTDLDDDRHCLTGTHCRAYDHIAKHPAYVTALPLCDPCLTAAARDVRTLLYDWYDLAQIQEPSPSQALDSQPGSRREPPMPLRGEPEALQREIHHVLTTWETEVRARSRLSEPTRPVPVASWNTTRTYPLPVAKTRHGTAVQRAVGILEPRLPLLARIGPTAVYPTGCEDTPTDLTGADAILHLQRLRARARATLGWTHRSHWLPGDCWTCDGRDDDPYDGPLYRAEPRYEGDEVAIWCDRCNQWRSWDDYQEYLTTLQWPSFLDQEPPAEVMPA